MLPIQTFFKLAELILRTSVVFQAMLTTNKRPNIIWIFGDQHRRSMLSRMGDPNVRTPNLDTLGEYGLTCHRAVSNFPLCCPARGTLLTGRHAHHVIPGHDYRMPEGQPTLANVFQESGYRTAWFGKWHVRGPKVRQPDGTVKWEDRPRHPQAPEGGIHRECYTEVERRWRGGFETWLGFENNNSPHNTWVHGHDENGEEIPLHRLDGFETDALTDNLIDYLGRRAEAREQGNEEPFFAALSVQPPHDPYAAPAEFMQHYNPAEIEFPPNVPDVKHIRDKARREYAGACAMVENLDWNVGRIREALLELSLDTETLIIFFSDHGDMHGSHGQFHKTAPWEESVGIPLLIGGGLDVQGNCIRRHTHQPIGLVDLAATTLGLCGIEVPDWMDGYDFSGLCSRGWQVPEPEDMPDSAFLQLVVPTGHGNSVDRPWRGVVTDDGWKYVAFENTDWLLFNLNEDPHEQVNLAHNTIYRKQRQRLRDRLQQWIAETGDHFSVPG